MSRQRMTFDPMVAQQPWPGRRSRRSSDAGGKLLDGRPGLGFHHHQGSEWQGDEYGCLSGGNQLIWTGPHSCSR